MQVNVWIPKDVLTSPSYDYSSLNIFGCEAYALIPKHQRYKLDPKSKKLIIAGYGDIIKGY
jgi:hypothetical protein